MSGIDDHRVVWLLGRRPSCLSFDRLHIISPSRSLESSGPIYLDCCWPHFLGNHSNPLPHRWIHRQVPRRLSMRYYALPRLAEYSICHRMTQDPSHIGFGETRGGSDFRESSLIAIQGDSGREIVFVDCLEANQEIVLRRSGLLWLRDHLWGRKGSNLAHTEGLVSIPIGPRRRACSSSVASKTACRASASSGRETTSPTPFRSKEIASKPFTVRHSSILATLADMMDANLAVREGMSNHMATYSSVS